VTLRRKILIACAALSGLLAVIAAVLYREDIWLTGLDPRTPHQIYEPPPAPDYAKDAAWALPPGIRTLGRADVFFIHPTTYDGGRHWNGPIDDPRAEDSLQRVMLPNYAGPFARLGRLFAPRYRQASLYATFRTREDAREARAFAYEDVRRAFRYWKARRDTGRPLILVGVEQGGLLADRLLREEIASDPALLDRLVAVYFLDAVVPAANYAASATVPACTARAQARCAAGYLKSTGLEDGPAARRLDRALAWTAQGGLEPFDDRRPLCVNPLTGAADERPAEARLNLGAANATGLEWGVRPGLLAREVSARCEGGVLRVSRPKSPSLKLSGSLSDRQKASPFNLFWADLEADAQARVAALTGRADPAWIGREVEIEDRSVRTID
jgi:hypothetical protein